MPQLRRRPARHVLRRVRTGGASAESAPSRLSARPDARSAARRRQDLPLHPKAPAVARLPDPRAVRRAPSALGSADSSVSDLQRDVFRVDVTTARGWPACRTQEHRDAGRGDSIRSAKSWFRERTGPAGGRETCTGDMDAAHHVPAGAVLCVARPASDAPHEPEFPPASLLRVARACGMVCGRRAGRRGTVGDTRRLGERGRNTRAVVRNCVRCDRVPPCV